MSMINENIGHCEQCGGIVATADDACQAMGTLYHASCFLCHKCGCSLKSCPFYYVSGFVYCEADFKAGGFFDREHTVLDSCSVCHKPIFDASLLALQRCYHRSCFTCTICNRPLADEQFCASPNDACLPLCLDDYWRMIAPTCSFCSKPILPSSKAGESHTLVVAKTLHRVDSHLGANNSSSSFESLSYHPHCVPSISGGK